MAAVGVLSCLDAPASAAATAYHVPVAPALPALPFSGRIESYQFLGLGRLSVAEGLCPPGGPRPVAYDETRGLVQLSFMKWTESPVGPYCASFVGLVVSPNMRPASARPMPLRPGRMWVPRAASILAAFLRAPRLLFVPAYVVGDVPRGPIGCGKASQLFGRDALDMRKTPGTFIARTVDGITHLQSLEEHSDDTGRTTVTGYSTSVSAPWMPGVRGGFRLPVSPSLLPCVPLLATAMEQARRGDGAQTGAILTPAASRPGDLVCIATRFRTRPSIRDLTSDRRATFTPLLLHRPAPNRALGAILEQLEFTPIVSMSDPAMEGSIQGPVPRVEDACA